MSAEAPVGRTQIILASGGLVVAEELDVVRIELVVARKDGEMAQLTCIVGTPEVHQAVRGFVDPAAVQAFFAMPEGLAGS